MTLKQISEALNTTIVPAIMGGDYTVNPDLSNIVDLGTAISAMTADQFKDYFNKFAAGVRTYVDARGYSPEELPLFVDSQEYGGIVQSIKSDFVETRGSNLYSLVDGQYYNDVNKYFGTKFDNKIFEKTDIFYVQSSKFFSGIQQYILQIKESLRFICGRVNFDFATYTVCRGDHANF